MNIASSLSLYMSCKMNVQTEITKLVDKSNKEYLQQFVHYVEGNGVAIKDYYKAFTAPSIINAKVQCSHTFKRGPNGGSRCGVVVKGDGIYCSKHKKQPIEEQSLKVDLENVLDEVEDLQDVDVEEESDEEWESNSDDGY